ncbi:MULTISPECIES: LysR family transcriptional regulator [unclassified Pseudomonas]|uniref:LysR family transcriptional regulator n=1 Tax=unclassified Pseudomonas TaxID=196821 RepID=UPI002AC9BABD|nr:MULTISPECIES: LysR family transcriptional regulator [unclassified Pseudomonas]MEB0048353.1 LysR family transcriptional regulator [Pseudomonas sp. Dout3]MEB0099006.1 LysR family transcriptional regulator [Pseudomonas sp. DC1.2]WPX60419.1 LysR family transcriptional regulator [Pseudomonas sp. DC1.2]
MRGSEFAQLRAFVAVVEHGSFVRAAAHLGMSASALSQTIRELEERLDVRLLNRTPRSVSPSDAGARLLLRLQPALNESDVALAGATHTPGIPSGCLRINAPRVAAIYYLAPLVGPFLNAYPGVSLDIVTDEQVSQRLTDGFDVGIRLGENLDQDRGCVELSGHLEMMVVASPAYLEQFGTPQTPHDLSEHQCLSCRGSTEGSPYRWAFEHAGERLSISVNGPLVVTEPEMLTRVALEGAGIAYLFEHQVREHITAGRLVHLLQDWTPAFPGFYLDYPNQQPISPALRAFLDFVQRPLRSDS